MKPPAAVGAAATVLGSRKFAVPAKEKGKLGSGTPRSSISSVAWPMSAATKTQQRFALPSMAPMQSSPELEVGGRGVGLSQDLSQLAAMVGEVAAEQEFVDVVAQVPVPSPTIRGSSGSLIGSVASLRPSASSTSTTSAACETAEKEGRSEKGIWVKM